MDSLPKKNFAVARRYYSLSWSETSDLIPIYLVGCLRLEDIGVLPYSNITAQAEVLFVIPKLISSQMKSGFFRTLEELQQNFKHTVAQSGFLAFFRGRGWTMLSVCKV